MLKIVEKSRLWITISVVVIAIGLGFLIFRGLNLGIDFAGGTIMQVDLKTQVNTEEIREIAAKYVSDASVQSVDATGIMIRSSSITNEQVESLKNEINTLYKIDSSSWSTETVGPSIGAELSRNALYAIILASVAMLIYVAVRFELNFGIAAIITLIHDILFTVGVYAVLQIPINSAFIAAILTVVGYSINDTIVIFDRIRENSKTNRKASLEELANASITQSLSRSINTVLTTLFTITALYFIGVSAVKELALPLILGIASGSYSSIFIATPIWLILRKRSNVKKGLVNA
ncbi:protein-export membrane protein SecF [Oxobacter pfennigii]|uniref:Protein-export membrane protein SecF n=1 Tax=Oxobacter pfennigii TaxID=36849 RepID=A0A0P9AHQ3_9CLOT|nr:protein translocase subunit SecF [Oxobacter pfennigii]KPU44988.1 protein-export membrane protein SecF [Oxobacter pfennigii]